MLSVDFMYTWPKIITFSSFGYQTENGLVEAVAVLVSTMPRLRPNLPTGKLGQCCKTRPDFIKVCLIKWWHLLLKQVSSSVPLNSLELGILYDCTGSTLSKKT